MPSAKSPVSRLLLVLFFGVVMVATVYGFMSRTWLPPVASKHGEDVDVVIHYLMITTGIIFVIGHVALIWMVWKHSNQEKTAYRPVSSKTEWIWALVPVVFMAVVSEAGVLVIGHPVWEQLYGDVPADTLEVEVVGKQFEWAVRYPGKDGMFGETRPELVHETRNPFGLVEDSQYANDDVVKKGILTLPVDRMVKLRLRSFDVQHSFSVPSFRVKQDLVPGFTTYTQFQPTKVGDFEIVCAELCGLGHYKMRGLVTVSAQEDFDAWLGKQIGWFE